MKSRIGIRLAIIILMIMTSAVGVVFFLGWMAVKPLSMKNGFIRSFIDVELNPAKSVARPVDVVSIAGASNSELYFETKDPNRIYVIEDGLKSGKYINLNIFRDGKKFSQFRCTVDSPNVYIYSGNYRTIINAPFSDSMRVHSFPTVLFTKAAFISDQKVVFRIFDGLRQIFALGNLYTGEVIKEKGISSTANDLGIASDGMLKYDKLTKKIVYVHSYTNKVVVMDSNLNLIKSMHTVDTITAADILTGKIGSNGIITNVGAKRLINAKCTVRNGVLFINSRIIADNEHKNDFRSSSIIDMYNIRSGSYLGSFHIPLPSKKLKDIQAVDDGIVILSSDKIIIYKLSFIKNLVI
jgi:hypothetical protein